MFASRQYCTSVTFCLLERPTNLTFFSFNYVHCSHDPKYLNVVLLTGCISVNTAKKSESVSSSAQKWHSFICSGFFSWVRPLLLFLTVPVIDVFVSATHSHPKWCKTGLELHSTFPKTRVCLQVSQAKWLNEFRLLFSCQSVLCGSFHILLRQQCSVVYNPHTSFRHSCRCRCFPHVYNAKLISAAWVLLVYSTVSV